MSVVLEKSSALPLCGLTDAGQVERGRAEYARQRLAPREARTAASVLSHPDSNRRPRNLTGSVLPEGRSRGLSPPVGNFTPPREHHLYR